MNTPQSSRNYRNTQPRFHTMSPQGGIVYQSQPVNVNPGAQTRPQATVSFLSAPTWTPTMRQTSTGEIDVQMKPQKDANAGHYLIIGAVVVAAAIFAAKKMDVL